MEKLEIKKNIERQKALYVLAMFSLIATTPSVLFALPGAESRSSYLVFVAGVQFLSFRRIRRLNRKLRFLS
jgi:hypothetical protein